LQIQFLQGHELFIPQHEALEKVIVGLDWKRGNSERSARPDSWEKGHDLMIVKNVISSRCSILMWKHFGNLILNNSNSTVDVDLCSKKCLAGCRKKGWQQFAIIYLTW